MTATIRTEGGDIIKSSTPTHKVTPNTVTISREVYEDTKKLLQWIGMTKEGVEIYNRFLECGK